MEATRRILEDRKSAGLSGGMQFTYRNPARSTDPGRILAGAAAMVVGAWPYGPGPGKRHGEDRAGTVGRAAVAGAGAGAGGGAGAGAGGDRGNGGHNETEARAAAAPRPKGQVARYARHDHYEDLRNALGQLADVLMAPAGGRGWWRTTTRWSTGRRPSERASAGSAKTATSSCPGGVPGSSSARSSLTPRCRPAAPVGDGCGAAGAASALAPQGHSLRPGVLDARKCLAWLVQATGVFPFEYRVALEGRIYGCDDCQEVCPANRLVARTADESATSRVPASA